MVRHGEDPSGTVEDLYDTASAAFEKLYGADLHAGYWDDPVPGAPSAADVPSAAARMTERLIEGIAVAPGQHVLDLGCGTGRPALRLARARGVRVTGISVSRREVDRANESSRRRRMAHRVRFEHADAMALPYAAASFDAAWAVESMGHMPDRAVVLGELARVLRPGARLLIADGYLRRRPPPGGGSAVEAVCAVFRMSVPPTLPGYTDLLADAGFAVVGREELSEHAWRSMAGMARLMEERSAELSGMFGEEAFARLSDALRGDGLAEAIGYVVLSAERR